MSNDTIVGLASVLWFISFFGGRCWLRKCELVKARPVWQIYLMFSCGGFAVGLVLGVVLDLSGRL